MNLALISRSKSHSYLLKKDKILPEATTLAALTHEVRNPLTNINLALEMLKRLDPGEGQQTYLDIIMRASIRINVLVTELAGRQYEQKKEAEYSVHQLLEEVLTMAGDRMRLKNITVSKDYTIQDYSLRKNNPGMKIALTNIIINAIDAMNDQGGVLQVTSTSINGRYILAIEDNGCGISAADLKNIFRPFFTRKTDGLGVGLAVTFNILKANHVKIDVESEEGLGTKFILSFKKTSPVFLISKTA